MRERMIDFLVRVNCEHSKRFCDPGMSLTRRLYRTQHPTEIGVLKCMDGRLHLPVITKTALGIIQPWRNLGGRFDLGWPMFGLAMKEWVEYAISRGRHCLLIVTYHYARGDKHRGCRGFEYDHIAAREFSYELKLQFERVFGTGVLYPIQCGIETDCESLVLHDRDGQAFDLVKLNPAQSDIEVI